MPVITGVALAGCTASIPVQRYIYTAPAPNGWSYRDDGTYAPPVAPPPPVFSPPVSPPPRSYSFIPRAPAAPPPVNDPPPPLQPVAPDPPALRFLPPVTFLTPPADATDCTGWWRICHFY
jgi:hypothetical protein